MFDAIAKGFRQAKNRLAGLTELTEQNIDAALREVRLSLLEADVELGVVKAFLARVKDKALGEIVRVKAKAKDGETMKVSAGDQFTKICHDELVAFMTAEGEALTFAEKGPTGIMMVGLQGSGKTTTCAKLARHLQKEKHKPLLVAADMQRPAAVVVGAQARDQPSRYDGRARNGSASGALAARIAAASHSSFLPTRYATLPR